MSLTPRVLLALLVLGGSLTPAFAKGDDDDDSDDTPKKKAKPDKSDKGDDDEDDDAKKPDKPKGEAKNDDEPETDQQSTDAQKQDLTGHDLGTKKKENEFEKDRFFVDKVDTPKTTKTTLIQGSITSSSFYYTESGGNYAGGAGGSDGSTFSRRFTELRIQTDFRHISGGKWDARFDGRIRVVNKPPNTPFDGLATGLASPLPTPARIQSGFDGQNEYELRELWVVRNGERSDVFLGRQFIPDLGAIKIDGVRVDYASSKNLTLIGFGGLYPVRGSRSLTTDYLPLKDNDGNPAGTLVGAGGFGGAYRTQDSYGAVGGVVLAPFEAESPRVYATSTGYLRYSPQLDLYHFAIVDLAGSNGFNLTNLSAGLNYKPNQRLRVTLSFNRVDTDTLNVQANAFLNPTDKTNSNNVVQNETFIQRLSTNSGRFGVSAALGQMQRYELSTAITYRYRPAITLTAPDGTDVYPLSAASGVDLFVSLVDRHSFKDMRLGLDLSRSFAPSSTAYDRSEVFAIRAFGSRELASGHGEWEVEVSYATTTDASASNTCTAFPALNGPALPTSVDGCYGSSSNSIISLGGNLYYRFNRDWLGIASVSLNDQSITALVGTVATSDPSIIGLTGFLRVAYRF